MEIEIKYENGEMTINTSEFFTSCKIGTFKKLLTMSEKSDLNYGTKTLEKWACAIVEEIAEVRLKAENEIAAYDVESEALNQKYYDPAYILNKKQIEKLKRLDDEKRRLRVRFDKSLKSLKNRSLKLEKLKKYLEVIYV